MGRMAPRIKPSENLELLEGQCDHPSHKTEDPNDDLDHDHEDLNDPHVWLSPTTLIVQSDQIAKKLKEILPEDSKSTIDANLENFKKDLNEIHAELSELLKPDSGKSFMSITVLSLILPKTTIWNRLPLR